jgi:hypothetical protein
MISGPDHLAAAQFTDHAPLSKVNSLGRDGVIHDPVLDFQTHHQTYLKTRAHHPWAHPYSRGALGATLDQVAK